MCSFLSSKQHQTINKFNDNIVHPWYSGKSAILDYEIQKIDIQEKDEANLINSLNMIITFSVIFYSARQAPFRLFFKTNWDEGNVGNNAVGNSLAVTPLATIGFSLNYVQQAC